MASIAFAGIRTAFIVLPLSGCVAFSTSSPARTSQFATERVPERGQSITERGPSPERGHSGALPNGDTAQARSCGQESTSQGHSITERRGEVRGTQLNEVRGMNEGRGAQLEYQREGRGTQLDYKRLLKDGKLQKLAVEKNRTSNQKDISVRSAAFEQPMGQEVGHQERGASTMAIHPKAGTSHSGTVKSDCCDSSACNPTECSHWDCEPRCNHPIDRLKARLQTLAIPVPGCYYDWQAKRNLPEGPDGASFHPLPTRPMFQPTSSSSGSWQIEGGPTGSPSGGCNYGQIPRGTQWHENSSQFLDSAKQDRSAQSLSSANDTQR